MAFYPVTDALQVRIVGALSDGHIWNNILWYPFVSPTLDQGDADSLATLVSGAYGQLLSYWHTGTTLTNIVVTDYRTEGAPQFTSTNDLPLVGTASDAPLPHQTSALVSWYTDFRGKAGRGRTYIPGFTEAGSAGDSPVSGLTTKLNDFADLIEGDSFAVAHRFSGSTEASTGSRRLKPTPLATGELHIIQTWKIAPAWATQRRRAIRV